MKEEKQLIMFNIGEEVEVSSKEEGFEDSWYIAKIIHTSKDKRKFFVEYKTLVDESETYPLKEYVSYSELRPLPPKSNTQSFKINEVVDAFINDGWWKGVITKIHMGTMYSVFFKDGDELEIKVKPSELRKHLQWTNGKWITTTTQNKELEATTRNEGSVQLPNPTGNINLSTDMATPETPSGVRDICWKNVKSSSRNICGRMDIQSTSNDQDTPSGAVYSRKKNMNQTAPNTDSEVLRPLKKLRHGEAEDTIAPTCKKVCNARGASIGSPTNKQYVLACPATKVKRNVIEAEDTEVIGFRNSHEQWHKEQHVVLPCKQMKEPLHHNEIKLREVGDMDKQKEKILERKREQQMNSGEKHKRRTTVPDLRTVPSKGPENESLRKEIAEVQTESTKLSDEQPFSVLLKKSRSHIKKGVVGGLIRNNEETEGSSKKGNVDNTVRGVVDKETVDGLKRKHGRPKGSIKKASVKGLEKEHPTEETTVVQVEPTMLSSHTEKEHQPFSVFLEKSSSHIVGDSGGSQLEVSSEEDNEPLSLRLKKFKSRVVKDNGVGVSDDNQVVSNEAITMRDTSLESFVFAESSDVVGSLLLDEHTTFVDPYQYDTARADETAGERALVVVDVTSNTFSSSMQQDDGPLPVQETSLPFIKSSDDLWGIIESKEIFCLLPQNPHFLPLKKYNEDLREGYAIGAMWSFAKLAEVTRKLKLKEPRSVLESKLTALMELEKLGFTVQQIQARLEKLLKIRDFIDQLDDRSKSVERKITKDQREVEHLQQSITQLKLKIQEKEKECSKLADLERKLNVTKESMQGLRLDFHRVVSTPW